MARIVSVADVRSRPGDFLFIPQSGWEAAFSYTSAGPSDPVATTMLARCTAHPWMRAVFAGACAQQADLTPAGATAVPLCVPRTSIFSELLKLAVSFAAQGFDVAAITQAQMVLLNPRVSPNADAVDGALWGGRYRLTRGRASVTLDVDWSPYKISFVIRP